MTITSDKMRWESNDLIHGNFLSFVLDFEGWKSQLMEERKAQVGILLATNSTQCYNTHTLC